MRSTLRMFFLPRSSHLPGQPAHASCPPKGDHAAVPTVRARQNKELMSGNLSLASPLPPPPELNRIISQDQFPPSHLKNLASYSRGWLCTRRVPTHPTRLPIWPEPVGARRNHEHKATLTPRPPA